MIHFIFQNNLIQFINLGNTDTKPKVERCKLNLENFDMTKILAKSSHLTGSEGTEYDLVAEGEQASIIQNEKEIASKLGLNPRLMGVEASDLFTADDLKPTTPSSQISNHKVPVGETLSESIEGLSRREMNRARRKVDFGMIKILYKKLSRV